MCHTYFRLTHTDRNRIEHYLAQGLSCNHIAIKIGVHRSTITREIGRNTDSLGRYRAIYAIKKTTKRSRSRSLGKRKILKHKPLMEYVQGKLREAWSPNQIAKTLPMTFPFDETMRISHEAIYQYIYVLPKGELKKTLIAGLRQRRAYRRIQRKKSPDDELRGKIKAMLSIHERPEEVAGRTVPGHWESDLIIGKYKRSAIATLVERTSRFTLIIPLPEGKGAVAVREALTRRVKELPQHLRKSLTHDQGKEMSEHIQFRMDTNMTVYFADPASPWQRGTNENTNGLIRQFFPKGTDFTEVSEGEIQRVEHLLNTRPRMTLDYKTPLEVFTGYVALDG